MKPEEKFKTLANLWGEHCRKVMFSSCLKDYLNHPTCKELMTLGRDVVPWIMERYQKDDLPWGFVLQEITGIKMIKDPNSFNPSEVKSLWLEWWEQQKGVVPYPANMTEMDRSAKTET